MKAALLGGFAILLAGIGTAPAARALPAAPLPELAAAGHTALLPIRHHRHHGYGRHWSDRYAPYSSQETEPPPTAPEATPAPSYRAPESGSAQPVVPPAAPSSRDTASRAARGSGSSRPAIRWVDPDRPAR
jgi:hypothetical protein